MPGRAAYKAALLMNSRRVTTVKLQTPQIYPLLWDGLTARKSTRSYFERSWLRPPDEWAFVVGAGSVLRQRWPRQPSKTNIELFVALWPPKKKW